MIRIKRTENMNLSMRHVHTLRALFCVRLKKIGLAQLILLHASYTAIRAKKMAMFTKMVILRPFTCELEWSLAARWRETLLS